MYNRWIFIYLVFYYRFVFIFFFYRIEIYLTCGIRLLFNLILIVVLFLVDFCCKIEIDCSSCCLCLVVICLLLVRKVFFGILGVKLFLHLRLLRL